MYRLDDRSVGVPFMGTRGFTTYPYLIKSFPKFQLLSQLNPPRPFGHPCLVGFLFGGNLRIKPPLLEGEFLYPLSPIPYPLNYE